MATAGGLQDLKRSATCPKCQNLYIAPEMITKCGHSFCKGCIPKTVSARRPGGGYQLCCFVCNTDFDKRSVRPNPDLEKMVKNVRALTAPPTCEEHPGQHLTFYCRRDESAICKDCIKSEEHSAHIGNITSLKKAAGQAKASLQKGLNDLRDQLEDLEDSITEKEERASELKSKFKEEEDSIDDLYEHLKQLQKEKKKEHLNNLKEDRREHLGKIQEKISDMKARQKKHRNLIAEIEEKCKDRDLELLKDVKYMLIRCDELKVMEPEIDFSDLDQIMQGHSLNCAKLKALIQIFKDKFWPVTVRVILDPDTAHPSLVLYEGGTLLMRTDQEQNQPDLPKRFTVSCSVLGETGFTSGEYDWEMELLQDEGWAVGVALESVGRKEQVTQSPEGGIWAVKGEGDKIIALTNPPTPLPNSQGVRKLGIYLNYENRELSVFNADSSPWVYLHKFSDAAFQGKVYPYFWVGGGEHTGLCKRQKTTEGFNSSQEEVLRLL